MSKILKSREEYRIGERDRGQYRGNNSGVRCAEGRCKVSGVPSRI